MVTVATMLEAYFDCRRSKRRTASAIVYEMDYESRIINLCGRINARTYQPGKSICFVVTRPRYREVFAASFEDRIVHHYIALRLEPLFEEIFSPRTFNCRKGKGQLYGINMLKDDIRKCSEDYTKDCYIMKLDLKGFFMSIDKMLLAEMIDRFILEFYKDEDIEDLRYLCHTVILHCPEKNCERHSPAEYWNYLPANKSLFTNGEGLGVAIGNLFAQIFANFLLNVLDWYLEEIGITLHGRYVDDFYCIHQGKAFLLACVPLIRAKLKELGLQLNERKFYIQHYTKGVEFTGEIVKPYRVYCCNRTITNFVRAVKRLNAADDLPRIVRAINSINSYLGLLRYCNEYGMRRKIINMIASEKYEYFYIKGHYESLSLKNKYKRRKRTLKRIRDGDY